MSIKVGAILIAFGASILSAASASALPVVNKGDLNRHCVQKYQPRGIQAQADPYAAARTGSLRCRLLGRGGYGFVIHNQSANEVCRRLMGTGRWVNQGGRVRCVRANTSSGNRGFVRNRGFQRFQPRQYRQPRCFRSGYRYICR